MINNLRHLIHSVYKLVNVNDTPTFEWNKHANAVMEVWTHEWQRQIKWNDSKFHRQRRHRAIKKNHINTRITIEFRWERNKVQTMESKNEMELYIIFNYSNDELEIYTMENIDDDMIWFSFFFIALLLSAKKKKNELCLVSLKYCRCSVYCFNADRKQKSKKQKTNSNHRLFAWSCIDFILNLVFIAR